jgi:hypothetical protein
MRESQGQKEYFIENIDTTVKENAESKKLLTQIIQEMQDTMRRPNLRIIGIEEWEDSQLKGPVEIINKIIEENLPNLKKEMPMNIQEACRTPNRLDQKRNSSRHILIKTPNALYKERILKAVREKGYVTYKGRPIRITPDFSPETMKAIRSWTDVIQIPREHKCQPRLLYPAKLSITIERETKIFHDTTKFTQFLSTNPTLQRIIDGKLQHKAGNYPLEKARK